MLEFDSDPNADRRGTAASTAGRRRRAAPVLPHDAAKLRDIPAFPGWARISEQAARPDEPAFFAGAGLALLDQLLAAEPPFAGALRQRLALRAATACARMARLREDERDLRDAEHLSAGAEPRPRRASPSSVAPLRLALPAVRRRDLGDGRRARRSRRRGEFRRSRRRAARRRIECDASARGGGAASVAAVRRARGRVAGRRRDLRAVGGGSGAGAEASAGSGRSRSLATTIAQPALRRGASGKRPRPGDLDWPEAAARAYALAARDAHALASRAGAPRGKAADRRAEIARQEASRVVELLLSDDATVAGARGEGGGPLRSRRRRLFDRLVALGAVRELSGRPSFRLYGL